MRKVEITTEIRTTPANVISASTEPDMLRDWWNVERTLIETRPGGLYTLAWGITDKGFSFVSTGIIKTYQPGTTLVVDNFVYLNPEKTFLGPMTLDNKGQRKSRSDRAIPVPGRLSAGVVDWDWYYEAVKQAWPVVVQALKNYLENNK